MAFPMDTDLSRPPFGRTRTATSIGFQNEESGDYCRICRGEGSHEQPLFYPCKCSGSIKFVHQDCLMEWLSHSQKKYCELCKTPFRFTKLYDQSMPATLPLPLFLRQICVHGLRSTTRWLRYGLVTFVWLSWLPWSIRQIWRGLFWIADGSWLSAQEIQDAVAAEERSHLANGTAAKLPRVFTTNTTELRATVSSYHVNPFGEMFASLVKSRLFRTLIQLVTSTDPVATSDHDTPSSHLNATWNLATNTRQASLLSDVQSLKSLTRFPVLNNNIIDMLEGQLVCLFVIATFILVFLIREWVINQQPILEMPEQEQADNPVPQPQPNEEARPAVRRRRRGIRPPADHNAQPDDVAVNHAQRPRAIPRPRRVATDDNLTFRDGERIDADRPRFPPRAASLVATSGAREGSSPQHEVSGTSEGPASASPADRSVHPPPLQRGVFDDLTGIRRSIEERDIADPWSANLIESLNQDAQARRYHVVSSAEHASGSDPPAFDQDNLSSALSADGHDVLILDSSTPSSSQTAEWGRSGSALTNAEVVTREESLTSSGGDDRTSLTSGDPDDLYDTSDSSGADAESPTSSEQGDVGGTSSESEEPRPADEPRSFWSRVAMWMWHVDDPAPVATLPGVTVNETAPRVVEAQPAAHVVADQIPAPDAPVQGPVPAPPREPNIQFGVDMNDPNAMDEAEDLEGILELIGMEGPVAGVIQNVLFSVFLLTLTLSASIWCPYIWGKIALLFLANPVGVFVKAPLFLLSRSADFIIDVVLFVLATSGLFSVQVLRTMKVLSAPIFPAFSNILKFALVEDLAASLSQNSGSRLEKAFSSTFFGLRPDLPTFSMQSHHALRVFARACSDVVSTFGYLATGVSSSDVEWYSMRGQRAAPWVAGRMVRRLPEALSLARGDLTKWLHELSADLRPVSFAKLSAIDYTLVEWTSREKIACIVLGYSFFAVAGCVYLNVAHYVLGLKKDEKVEGFVADSLRQAGGVLKVVVIIGIEMIVFPLYCGAILDLALLPLFEGASFHGRLMFAFNAPVTALFVHWFIGTCYMFHFALFVSMCRKIMRKGVLYFIRDPDDPSFHPVRDVLERPVATQLGKIAFSACVYGGLVIVCLGGVVFALSCVGDILPIHWTTSEPRLAFPMDVVFYNLLLPFVLRKVELSKKISMMYEWWFRGCASGLRLTHFLFGDEVEEEKHPSHGSLHSMFGRLERPPIDHLGREKTEAHLQAESTATFDGTYVRAPATDSVKIPKGTRVFLEVNKDNERIDGMPDEDGGLHGKQDERFAKIYIPPHFKARVTTFIVLAWVFAGFTGVLFTVLPLTVGRTMIQTLAATDAPPNDLYAVTVGIHVCGCAAYVLRTLTKRRGAVMARFRDLRADGSQLFPKTWRTVKYILGLLYVGFAFGIVLPFGVSLLSELYIHMPVYSYLISSTPNPAQGSYAPAVTTVDSPSESARSWTAPTIFAVQTWTVGVLYLRVILKFALNHPNSRTQAAVAFRSIARQGMLRPDIELATRAFILPATVSCGALITVPLFLAKVVLVLFGITRTEAREDLYRYSYPALLAVFATVVAVLQAKERIRNWRSRVRDEIYLIGERLHNFHDETARKKHQAKFSIPSPDLGGGNLADEAGRAFEELTGGVEPEEIRELRRQIDDTQRGNQHTRTNIGGQQDGDTSDWDDIE